MKAIPSNCLDCPFSRHLYYDRFACGNGVNKVVRGREFITAECRDALLNLSHRYFQPLPLPDLQGLEPEWICDRIHLSLNWLDVYERSANEGEIAVEVCLDDVRIGYLRRDADAYYCDRLDGLRSSDPYWLALHLVHPDYLYQVPDEMVADRSLVPNYF
jgi:hypothetical protein